MTLRQWLRVSGTSVRVFAQQIEVSESTVHRWLGGARVRELYLANRIWLVTRGEVGQLDLESTWAEWRAGLTPGHEETNVKG